MIMNQTFQTMSKKIVVCWCPKCKRETLHEEVLYDTWTNAKSSKTERFFHTLFTVGLGFGDFKNAYECKDCGHLKL